MGTNKPDAAETVAAMLEDLSHGMHLLPAHPKREDIQKLVQQRQPDYFSYADWLRLNTLEIERGQAQGRPRIKFTRIAEMLAVLNR